MRSILVGGSLCALVAIVSIDGALTESEEKRQDLVPFPRIGKRQGLIPFPRIGRSMGMAAGGQFVPPSEDQVLYSPDDEENWDLPIDMPYVMINRYLKRGGGGHSAFTPRIGRKKRSIDEFNNGGKMGFAEGGGQDYNMLRRALWPEEFQAFFSRTMRQLIPSPRIGRADAFVPRLGKKSAVPMTSDFSDEDDEYAVKRAGTSAFTPRIGRAAFTPRVGRAGQDGQMRSLRAFTPRIGK